MMMIMILIIITIIILIIIVLLFCYFYIRFYCCFCYYCSVNRKGLFVVLQARIVLAFVTLHPDLLPASKAGAGRKDAAKLEL